MPLNSYDLDDTEPVYGIWFLPEGRWGRLTVPIFLQRRYRRSRSDERIPLFVTIDEALKWMKTKEKFSSRSSFTVRHKNNPQEDISNLLQEFGTRTEHALKYL